VSEQSRPFPADDLHRLLFDQAAFGMVATDRDGRIVAWNLAASKIFGSNPRQMIGTQWASVIPASGRTIAIEMMDKTLGKGDVTEFEFWHRDEQGRRRHLATVTSPVRDASGRQIGALASLRDVTNRVALQVRLSQQSKMAAMGEMAGALAHHLNNILGGVVTSVDFALETGDPDSMPRMLQQIQKALARATSLMNNVLKFAEGDARQGGLCDLTEALIDLVTYAELKIRDRGVDLTVDLKFIPVLEVLKTQIQTVLRNVLDNAIEAMPDGGELTIESLVNDQDVAIRITDTGCGLDEESLTRIFEPFYSTKRRGPGASPDQGLGLAVAHGILKMIGGSVGVTSSLGEGTTVEVRLPLNPEHHNW